MVATPPRSHQLAAGSITAGGVLTEFYAAPVGKVVIVKTISLHQDTGTFGHVYAYIKTGGVEYTYLELNGAPTPATITFTVDQVLEEGDELGLFVVTLAGGDQVRYLVSGSVLTNP